jgi:hypothetical protein
VSDDPLIDRYLPSWDARERHTRRVAAPGGDVYDAVRKLDLSRSRWVRILFRLRGLPESALTLNGLLRLGFVELGQRPGRELLLGLVGRFWTLTGEIREVSPEEFRSFDRPGFAKAAWNFTVSPDGGRAATLATETRVRCLDPASRRKFGLYWTVVRPFSGWIRREALRAVAEAAEPPAPSG